MSFLKTDRTPAGAFGTLGILIFLALVSSPHAWAQNPPDIPKEKYAPASLIVNNELAFIQSISDILKALESFNEKGDSLAVGEEIEKIQTWKKRLGSRNLFFISRYFLLKAEQLARGGDLRKAVETAKDAVAISPDDHMARLSLARHSFNMDKANVKGYIRPLAFSAVAYFKDLENVKIFFFRLLIILAPALFITYVLYAAASLLAYRKALANDIRRMMPFEMGVRSAGAVFALLILALLAGGGVFLTAFVIPFFLLGYLKGRARTIIFLFLFSFAVTPILAKTVIRGLAVETSDAARMIGLYKKGNWEPGSVMTLESALAKEPDNPEALLALATLYRKKQNFFLAQEYINRTIENNDKDVRAIVELGNVNFSMEKYEEAKAYYKKALELSPNLIEAHYNLSNAYYELLNTDEGAREYSIAMQIDKKLTNSFVKKSGDDKTTKVVSFTADLSKLEVTKPHTVRDAENLFQSLWTAFIGGVKETDFLMGVAGYFVALFIAVSIWGRSGSYNNCRLCGTPYLPPFTVGGKEVVKCNQCLVLSASKKKQLSAAKRNRKLAQIKAYHYGLEVNTGRLNTVFPGLGSVYNGSYLSGAILIGITSFFIVKLVYVVGPMAVGYRPDFSGNIYSYAAWGAAFIVFYLFSLLLTRREA